MHRISLLCTRRTINPCRFASKHNNLSSCYSHVLVFKSNNTTNYSTEIQTHSLLEQAKQITSAWKTEDDSNKLLSLFDTSLKLKFFNTSTQILEEAAHLLSDANLNQSLQKLVEQTNETLWLNVMVLMRKYKERISYEVIDSTLSRLLSMKDDAKVLKSYNLLGEFVRDPLLNVSVLTSQKENDTWNPTASPQQIYSILTQYRKYRSWNVHSGTWEWVLLSLAKHNHPRLLHTLWNRITSQCIPHNSLYNAAIRAHLLLNNRYMAMKIWNDMLVKGRFSKKALDILWRLLATAGSHYGPDREKAISEAHKLMDHSKELNNNNNNGDNNNIEKLPSFGPSPSEKSPDSRINQIRGMCRAFIYENSLNSIKDALESWENRHGVLPELFLQQLLDLSTDIDRPIISFFLISKMFNHNYAISNAAAVITLRRLAENRDYKEGLALVQIMRSIDIPIASTSALSILRAFDVRSGLSDVELESIQEIFSELLVKGAPLQERDWIKMIEITFVNGFTEESFHLLNEMRNRNIRLSEANCVKILEMAVQSDLMPLAEEILKEMRERGIRVTKEVSARLSRYGHGLVF